MDEPACSEMNCNPAEFDANVMMYNYIHEAVPFVEAKFCCLPFRNHLNDARTQKLEMIHEFHVGKATRRTRRRRRSLGCSCADLGKICSLSSE